jgi:hypothetical protein
VRLRLSSNGIECEALLGGEEGSQVSQVRQVDEGGLTLGLLLRGDGAEDDGSAGSVGSAGSARSVGGVPASAITASSPGSRHITSAV